MEQAFYTSNEEGMGVSPNAYNGQNRMPAKPAYKPRTPPHDQDGQQAEGNLADNQ